MNRLQENVSTPVVQMKEKHINYVEIEKFKTFDEKIRIDFGHPAVLIGPNNAGKTSVIQALALWSRGIRAWREKKGQPRQKTKRERLSAGINRLNLFELPVQDTRQLWRDTRVSKNNKAIQFSITVGLNVKGVVKPCKVMFTRRDSETIYCRPDASIVDDEELLDHASDLKFNLLYPMSGIESQETLLQEGRINVLMGQGQTAQVLRNLAYMIKENDDDDWSRICRLIEKLFLVKLKDPVFNEVNGILELSYQEGEIARDLDISMSGRGLQQMLLILTYLYSHKRSVLLIDEPDAHLEILRQRQVYAILKEVAAQNQCQVVIATHSEVILEDAVDTNLTLLIGGTSVDMAKENDMKAALRSIGIEHYYKARVHPRILYVEGSSDIDILKAFAKKLGHQADGILEGRLNCYYVQDVSPENTLEAKLDRSSGFYEKPSRHFHLIRRFVPEFKGLAILDSDGRAVERSTENGLVIDYWANYEIENYFITYDVLVRFVDQYYEDEAVLFKPSQHNIFVETLNECLLEEIFSGDESQLDEFLKASKGFQRTVLKNTKMSKFAEIVFRKFSEKQNQPILLTKGEFYRLIEFVKPEDLPEEVVEKLDMIVSLLSMDANC
jgi:ABC-type cobalamin/Fe3+-siderophores transport system ATPase subunit